MTRCTCVGSGHLATFGTHAPECACAFRDFSTPTFPIFAIAKGTVLSIVGDTVLMEYEDGTFARYFHVNEISVSAGDTVVHGQQIGTGR